MVYPKVLFPPNFSVKECLRSHVHGGIALEAQPARDSIRQIVCPSPAACMIEFGKFPLQACIRAVHAGSPAFCTRHLLGPVPLQRLMHLQ